MDINIIRLAGAVLAMPQVSHESHGVTYYGLSLSAARKSGVRDILRVLVPGEKMPPNGIAEGDRIAFEGALRTFNNRSGVGSKLVISAMLKNFYEYTEDENELWLSGKLCKPAVYRKTPLGREITDLLLSVSRQAGVNKSDYLPCVTWGACARMCAALEAGDGVNIAGRLQSRVYIKREGDAETEKTAIEVSVSTVEIGQ